MGRSHIKLQALAFTLGLAFCESHAADAFEGMSFLDNGETRVGVDLGKGGAITWLSRAGGDNVINNFDLGRQVQLSYFSGPVPFEANGLKPATHWQHIGWNPIQAGDDFHHGSKVIAHRNDGHAIQVKCVPLQWPLNNVPGECTIETWIELDGPVVKVRAKLLNQRTDTTGYPARLQELPALYANAPFHRVVSYTGAHPFSGEPVQAMPKSQTQHPWTFWLGTEQWSALLNDKDQGVGLITPGRIFFTGGFAGQPGPNDTHATHTGYLAGQTLEVLDHNIEHDSHFELLPGTLQEIRTRAAANSALAPALPAWVFKADRQGWHYQNASDTGWPIRDAIHLKLDATHDPQLISPAVFWLAEKAPVVTIEAAFQTHHKTATIYWRHLGEAAPGSSDALSFPIIGDGKMRQYEVPLVSAKTYTGALVQLRLDPVPDGWAGEWVQVKAISLRR